MNMSDQRKKVRSSNFSNEEKVELLNLIGKYKKIIENKKTDKVSTKDKNEVWETICGQFNASSPDGMYRSTDSIKKFYENKKKEVRKTAARERIDINKTGGGIIYPKVKTDPIHDLVLSIINTKTVYGLENQFDCDDNNDLSAAEITNEHVDTSQDITFELNRDIQDENVLALESPWETVCSNPEGQKESSFERNSFDQSEEKRGPDSAQKNWSRITPSALQKPKSTELRRIKKDSARRRPATVIKALTTSEIGEKYNNLLDKRLEIASWEKKNYEDQIKKRDQEQVLKMTLLKMDFELKNKELQRNGIVPFKLPCDN